MLHSFKGHASHCPPGSSIHGISQARVLEWVAISLSRGSSRPREWTRVPALQADALSSESPGEHASHYTHVNDTPRGDQAKEKQMEVMKWEWLLTSWEPSVRAETSVEYKFYNGKLKKILLHWFQILDLTYLCPGEWLQSFGAQRFSRFMSQQHWERRKKRRGAGKEEQEDIDPVCNDITNSKGGMKCVNEINLLIFASSPSSPPPFPFLLESSPGNSDDDEVIGSKIWPWYEGSSTSF